MFVFYRRPNHHHLKPVLTAFRVAESGFIDSDYFLFYCIIRHKKQPFCCWLYKLSIRIHSTKLNLILVCIYSMLYIERDFMAKGQRCSKNIVQIAFNVSHEKFKRMPENKNNSKQINYERNEDGNKNSNDRCMTS